jgi:hypothetical protein
MMTPLDALPKPTPVLSPIQPCSHLSIHHRRHLVGGSDLAVVGLVQEQEARCATRETQVPGSSQK